MNLKVEFNGICYQCQTEDAHSIAIELFFDGYQPEFFDAPPARRTPLRIRNWLADTSAGGSCNVDRIEMIPHCNGTHTETIAHVVSDWVPVSRAVLESLLMAALVTVSPVPIEETLDSYRPGLDELDFLITRERLETAMEPFRKLQPTALIVRTLPNFPDKPLYKTGQPPFFSNEAMELIVETNIEHLLVDIPSIDREHDEGKLSNHRLYWNLPEIGHTLTDECYREKTITEMIYVDTTIADGLVLLNLQISPFSTDAAPSRPVIWRLQEVGV